MSVVFPLTQSLVLCTTLVFIRAVTDRIDGSIEISKKLDGFLIFLDAFSDVCYSDVTGLLRDSRVHSALSCDIEYSLYSLNKCLAAHREAWRYVSVVSDAEQRKIETVSSSLLEGKSVRKKWRDSMKERSQVWKERARPGLCLALFGREEMQELILNCEKLINRLRQTLEIVFLTIGPPSRDFAGSWKATVLGVVDVLERQRRARKRPSSSYNALPGSLRKCIDVANPADGVIKTVYKYIDEEVDVLVDTRTDDEIPTPLMCHLTWLLQAPTSANISRQNHDYQLHTLNCMGFIDDPINHRGLVLYQTPQSHPWQSNPLSLHNLMRQGSFVKPTLNCRFRTARILASTILATHASGWVHRNVCSRSVLMLPQTLNDLEPSPYLVGWGVPLHSSTSIFRLEPNLYQHQERFGKPSSEYKNVHDIYSLGVVLLELGVWRPLSSIFAKRLEKYPHFGETQQHDLFAAINSLLVDRASGLDIRKEMGDTYAEVVRTCLTWPHQDAIEGMIEFRKRVVDPLTARGML